MTTIPVKSIVDCFHPNSKTRTLATLSEILGHTVTEHSTLTEQQLTLFINQPKRKTETRDKLSKLMPGHAAKKVEPAPAATTVTPDAAPPVPTASGSLLNEVVDFVRILKAGFKNLPFGVFDMGPFSVQVKDSVVDQCSTMHAIVERYGYGSIIPNAREHLRDLAAALGLIGDERRGVWSSHTDNGRITSFSWRFNRLGEEELVRTVTAYLGQVNQTGGVPLKQFIQACKRIGDGQYKTLQVKAYVEPGQ